MRLLLIHQNFPGQFRHLAPVWADRPDRQVLALGRDTAPGLPGLDLRRYTLARPPHRHQHPYLRKMEEAVLHGQAVARVLLDLKRGGYRPDLILAHPGWGETLYAKDIYPDSRLIHYCEWYYHSQGADMDFDPEFPLAFDARARIRTWNALHLLNLENCDQGVTPTAWQLSRQPAAYRPRITLAHEGIPTHHLAPDPRASLELPGAPVLRAGDPVITYVARNLEPYRGIHVFLRALANVQRRHPGCHAVIVGGDDTSYGGPPKDAANWREALTRQLTLDPARTHFTGRVPYATYRRVLQVSAVHVYLTYPFVLSWSLLEALASGCLVIGSRTAPVEEVIRHGHNGLLCDFHHPDALADLILDALADPTSHTPLRQQGRQDVLARYSQEQGQAQYERLLMTHPA